ncbi:molybdenum cofactor synthesis domain-containing protein [Caldicoprobacter guelmensis]|uniref:molybdenum cofactor synthesis domain-containing protein n=1 Tax=Caldicoprobacter guelmensis TaxID=1170224 RepID=UPI00195AAA43|nr:molybdenum cofactor synthesis domain-containing protein [Caldicoprobacter guelmensis]
MKDYHFSAVLPDVARKSIEEILKEHLALESEVVSIYSAGGRFVSRDYFSVNTCPPVDVAAMDGYAINAQQTYDVTDVQPKVIKDFKVVQTGHSIENYDAVVPFEEAQKEDEGIKIFKSYYPRQNVRSKGEDVQKGQMIVKKGELLGEFEQVYLKAGGYREVEVYKMPRVAFLPTGDELVDLIENQDQLVEFNSVIFSNLLKRYGFDVGVFEPVPNDVAQLVSKIESLLEEYDMVFINGGSSKGDMDLTAEVISRLGEVVVHGVAIKPGKPTIIGRVGTKLVMGLPGYPVSMFFAVRELFLEAFFNAYGLDSKQKKAWALLERRVFSDMGSEEYIRVSIENQQGRNLARVLKRGASVVSSLKRADGYIVIPVNADLLEEGNLVEVKLI